LTNFTQKYLVSEEPIDISIYRYIDA